MYTRRSSVSRTYVTSYPPIFPFAFFLLSSCTRAPGAAATVPSVRVSSALGPGRRDEKETSGRRTPPPPSPIFFLFLLMTRRCEGEPTSQENESFAKRLVRVGQSVVPVIVYLYVSDDETPPTYTEPHHIASRFTARYLCPLFVCLNAYMYVCTNLVLVHLLKLFRGFYITPIYLITRVLPTPIYAHCSDIRRVCINGV